MVSHSEAQAISTGKDSKASESRAARRMFSTRRRIENSTRHVVSAGRQADTPVEQSLFMLSEKVLRNSLEELTTLILRAKFYANRSKTIIFAKFVKS